MVMTTGPRSVLAGSGAVVLVAAIIFTIIVWGENAGALTWIPFVALALTMLGLALGRYALRQPPPPREVILADAPQVRRFRRPVLILNPRSGGGKVEQFDLVNEAAALGIETILLEKGMDLGKIAHDAIAAGADVVGMAGGDGSQAYVLSIAIEQGVPFVCVPAGTRNHFALDLGLDRADPRQALTAFVNGEDRFIDYATVNDRVFVNNVALGVYAAIVEQETYRDAKLHTTLELLPKLVAEGGPWFDLHFDVPDHGHVDQSPLLMVSNNPYDITTEIGQRLRLDGGVLGMLTLNPESLGDLVSITLLAAAGIQLEAKALWAWAAPEFIVESDEATLSAGVDGETISLETPLVFRSVPGGAHVIVPAGTLVGLDEQRVSGPKYSGLLEVAFNLPRD
jgi:diacylglycerol kinase family enzyme